MASAGAQSPAAGPTAGVLPRRRAVDDRPVGQPQEDRPAGPTGRRRRGAPAQPRRHGRGSGASVDVTVAAFGTDAVEVGTGIPARRGGRRGRRRCGPSSAARPTSTPTTCWPCRSPSATSRPSPTCRRTASGWCGSPTGPTASTSPTPRASPTTRAPPIGPRSSASSRARSAAGCPGPSRLPAPLSQQIRQAGFVVQLVDLRSDGVESEAERRDREATTPVIDRLLSGDANDGCTVPGGSGRGRPRRGPRRRVLRPGPDRPRSRGGRVHRPGGRVPGGARAGGDGARRVSGPIPRGHLGRQALARGDRLRDVGLSGAPVARPPGPTIAAGSADGAAVDGCYADLRPRSCRSARSDRASSTPPPSRGRCSGGGRRRERVRPGRPGSALTSSRWRPPSTAAPRP